MYNVAPDNLVILGGTTRRHTTRLAPPIGQFHADIRILNYASIITITQNYNNPSTAIYGILVAPCIKSFFWSAFL